MRFESELPEGQQFSDLTYPALAISPDGKQFVYSTAKGLHLRSVHELTAKPIAGTEGSTSQPFCPWFGRILFAGSPGAGMNWRPRTREHANLSIRRGPWSAAACCRLWAAAI